MEEIKRNCNTCKSGLFARCKALKENKEYQAIWERAEQERGFLGSVDAHKFKENFICDEYKCLYIEYPIEVSAINRNTVHSSYRDSQIGKFASIRPCGEECNKTHLGLYLGDLPLDITVSHNPETKELNLSYMSNPAIFVFDLNKIVYGMESWWSIIETKDDLKEITDLDIENVWYVKAMKSICNGQE